MAQSASTTRMKLICATLDKAGALYSVDVPASDLIDNVKERIHATLFSPTAAVRAPDLTLYIARDDAGFIPYGDDASHQLREFGVVLPRVEAMLQRGPLVEVDTVADVFGRETGLPSRSIHLLVRVPTMSRTRSVLDALFAPGYAKRVRLVDAQGNEKDVAFFEMQTFPPMADPTPASPHVLIREAYQSIWHGILPIVRDRSAPNILVTGPSGVGTSRLFLYLLWRLTTTDQDALGDRILVINSEATYTRVVDGALHRLTPAHVYELRRTRNVVRLMDDRSNDMHAWRGVSVLCGSPDVDGLSTFCKHAVRFLVPPWSYRELAGCNALLPPARRLPPVELQRRVDRFGGNPRFVLSTPVLVEEYSARIERVLACTDARTMLGHATTWHALQGDTLCHRLCTMVSDAVESRITAFHLEFASKAIAAAVVEKAELEELQELFTFAMRHREDEDAAVGRQ